MVRLSARLLRSDAMKAHMNKLSIEVLEPRHMLSAAPFSVGVGSTLQSILGRIRHVGVEAIQSIGAMRIQSTQLQATLSDIGNSALHGTAQYSHNAFTGETTFHVEMTSGLYPGD